MQTTKWSESRWEPALSLAARIFVWALLFGMLWVLRSFFLLIFLTFVFAYIQASAVDALADRIAGRNTRVICVALALLGVILFLSAFLIPRFREQTAIFAQRFPSYIETLDEGLAELRGRYPGLKELLPDAPPADQARSLKESPSAAIIQQLLGVHSTGDDTADLKPIVGMIRDVGSTVLGVISAFFLSLLFSFLIVLDLPSLSASVRNLSNTKIGFVYDEVAGSLYDFGLVMGRALGAQFYIALANTVLTAGGVFLMGLGNQVAFLSVIVFICSFIPFAGVFISSVPICLLALQESGLSMMLAAILLITVIHLIEGYVLNPRIYGHRLRMNPVIVLIILTIMGKLFHVWGLILGVPVANYIFNHAIRYRNAENASAGSTSHD